MEQQPRGHQQRRHRNAPGDAPAARHRPGAVEPRLQGPDFGVKQLPLGRRPARIGIEQAHALPQRRDFVLQPVNQLRRAAARTTLGGGAGQEDALEVAAAQADPAGEHAHRSAGVVRLALIGGKHRHPRRQALEVGLACRTVRLVHPPSDILALAPRQAGRTRNRLGAPERPVAV